MWIGKRKSSIHRYTKAKGAVKKEHFQVLPWKRSFFVVRLAAHVSNG